MLQNRLIDISTADIGGRPKHAIGSRTRSCRVSFQNDSLEPRWRGGFLLACVYDVLKQLGESRPYATRVRARAGARGGELRQFMQLPTGEDGVVLDVSGAQVDQTCRRLPQVVAERLSKIAFDSDGFAYPRE